MSELRDPNEPDKLDFLIDQVQALVVMNMRVYDLLMAHLATADRDLAKKVWELHNEGKNKNPKLWQVPDEDED